MGKWEMVRLGDYIKQVRGVSYKPEDVSEDQDGNHIPVLRAHNIQTDGLNFNNLVFVNKQRIQQIQFIRRNDIVVCASSGSKELVGKAAQSSEDMMLSFGAFCKVVRPQKGVNPRYLKHYFNSTNYRKIISDLSAGANISNLRNEHIDELKLPLPPLPTQQKIADALDKASALIEMRKAQIEKLDLLIKSQFIEMFGDPVTNPMGWKTVQIKEVFNIRSSKRVFQSELTSNGVPFFRVSDLVRKIENKDGNSDLYISESKFKSLFKDGFVPKTNDVLITTRGTLGKCYIIKADDRFYFQDGMISWLESTRVPVSTIYISYLFQTDYIVNQIKEVSKGATVDFLSLNKLGSLHALLPNINVQTKFASFVESIEKRKSELQVSLIELENCNKALMQKCFSGEMF